MRSSSARLSAAKRPSGSRHDRRNALALFRNALFSAVLAVFGGTLVLTAMIDFLEMMRRSGDMQDVSAFLIAKITLFRVPFITERVLPFAVLVGAMFCYLNLSRRLELVVARCGRHLRLAIHCAGARDRLPDRCRWRRPFTTRSRRSCASNPLAWRPTCSDSTPASAMPAQRLLVAPAQRGRPSRHQRQVEPAAGHPARRRDRCSGSTPRGTSWIASRPRAATLEPGYWRLEGARFHVSGIAPAEREIFRIKTTLTPAQVGKASPRPRPCRSGASPRISPRRKTRVWRRRVSIAILPIAGATVLSRGHGAPRRRRELALFPHRRRAENRPWRDCGGFLLYVLAKMTGDLSKAGMLPPIAAAGLPPPWVE